MIWMRYGQKATAFVGAWCEMTTDLTDMGHWGLSSGENPFRVCGGETRRLDSRTEVGRLHWTWLPVEWLFELYPSVSGRVVHE